MNGRDFPKGTLEDRKKKVSTKGLNCYFSEGFSANFVVHLSKFATFIWRKGAKYEVDLEEFLDAAVCAVYEKLSQGMYDETKASFTTYIFSVVRNVGSSFRSKQRHYAECGEDFSFDQFACRDESDHSKEVHSFIERSRGLGYVIDLGDFDHDVRFQVDSPLVEVFYCLRHKGEL